MNDNIEQLAQQPAIISIGGNKALKFANSDFLPGQTYQVSKFMYWTMSTQYNKVVVSINGKEVVDPSKQVIFNLTPNLLTTLINNVFNNQNNQVS